MQKSPNLTTKSIFHRPSHETNYSAEHTLEKYNFFSPLVILEALIQMICMSL